MTKQALHIPFILLLSGLLLSSNARPIIYKSTDKEGNVTFSDTQTGRNKGEVVELKPFTPTKIVVPEPLPATKPDEKKPGYQQLTIAAPENHSTHRANGNITVEVEHDPESLHPGHRLALFINGVKVQESKSSNRFKLTNLSRGEHYIEAKILNASDKLLKSAACTIYVFRPTIRNNPPAKERPKPIPVPQT
uniref:DUF4124 domain-containing protein n=1 Tax=Endozoicomonas sp. Mp262 TaxID=2919499 RepID=UPI00351B5D1F